MPSLKYPSVGMQVLSSLVHFLGVSVLSHCFSRRVAAENFSSLEGLRNLTWARICIILVFVDSWLFLFSSGVLIFGIGLELHHSTAVCIAGAYTCIIFYATSKLLIYAFLIERVHVVWTPATGIKRFKSPIYILCSVAGCFYIVVICLMFVGRSDYLRDQDGVCVIGLRHISSYPLLIYDLYINIFLTVLFLFPLLKTTSVNPRTRRIAWRTLIATAVSLITSATNIGLLVVTGGNELGWVCLGSCGTDVIVNALSLFWVTSATTSREVETSTSIYVVENQNKIANQPARSILKSSSFTSTSKPIPEAFSPTSTQYTSGPHRITNAYYQFKDGSQASSSYGTISLSERPQSIYPQDPTHPFARATYMPKMPEPVIRISANPDPNWRLESPSALRSLASLFRRDCIMEDPEDIQITVTTDIETVSFHDSISEDCHEDTLSHRPRACSV